MVENKIKPKFRIDGKEDEREKNTLKSQLKEKT